MRRMIRNSFSRRPLFLFLPALLLFCAAASTARAQAPDIGVSGFYATNRAQQGRTVQAVIVLDVPSGYHVNANKTGNKFSIPTTVKIEAPEGARVSAVTYPRGAVRTLKFSKEPLALYEGRAVMRFNVTLPANFKTGETELRARVRYQACNDEVCYPPATREVTMPIAVVAPTEQVRAINRQFFGGARK
ncbi:MAG: protein-disulfide reductase DsbD N-terminal domain-containing protein [Acidobacteria bacterium]|nr:protein-disulfide reductase DsbD N-terminal domain-containing protein [Acidobacteriota bacterium]MCA1641302.1 protein-disulfide reductase DsbD N-terminal domain-containing protein [Acidobacteriota bacterium]